MSCVNGPIEVSMSNLDTNQAFIEVSYHPKCGLSGVNDRYREKIIRKLCEKSILTTIYPRTAISIQVQEMDDNGGIFACAVNSVTLSLINSGLDMNHLMAGVHCGLDNDDVLHLDPESNVGFLLNRNHKHRSKKFKASFTFVYENINKSIVGVHTDGSFSMQKYNEAVELCRNASEKIFDFYKSIIKKYATVIWVFFEIYDEKLLEV